ncbi:MAG: type II toxin-antitoxin system HipA family toxin [Planctomycetia bacterium]|nr:type II toxin-antitoxin system HipA family toxin [Planctomycetia bacterium]
MTALAKVNLWGTTIGVISLEDGDRVVRFQYTPDFVPSGIEAAPLTMPLSNRIYSFPELSQEGFRGLPGLLIDSLPDKFGNALIQNWLARQGRTDDSFNVIERLCYTGSRGMGALEYEPAMRQESNRSEKINIEHLVELAREVLTSREKLSASFRKNRRTAAINDILRVGTSAGGARAKAVIAWNPETNEIRSGQTIIPKGFEHWLLKFDGMDNNKDRELLADPKGYGKIEFAYYLMAVDCGIEMSECRLFTEGNRSHFMTRRFDRLPDGGKLHYQSLAAMAHLDYSMPGTASYEQVFGIFRLLGFSHSESSQFFRRMVFNIIARNQDDHVKNIGFLMDRTGRWTLAPAFDVTYNYQPTGQWTASHQMTLNGKRSGFDLTDFQACAKTAQLKRGEWKKIIHEVYCIVRKWPEYANQAAVSDAKQNKIAKTLYLKPFEKLS